jgi:hypothetical protein
MTRPGSTSPTPQPPRAASTGTPSLSTSINSLTDAGLGLGRAGEPRLIGGHAERRPVWAEVPADLVARCRKGTPGQIS